MSFAVKKRIALAILLLVSVWPLAHHALATRLDVNPWKWFGWSMYTSPPPVLNVYPLSTRTGQVLSLSRLSPEARRDLQRVYEQFGKRRVELGRWVEPTNFARALLALYPDEQGIELVVQRARLDRETAIFKEERRTSYVYDRAEFEAAVE